MVEKSPETSLLTKSSRDSAHTLCVYKLGGWPWRRFKKGQGQMDLGETNRSDICLTTYHYDGERLMRFIHQTSPGQINVSGSLKILQLRRNTCSHLLSLYHFHFSPSTLSLPLTFSALCILL